MVINLIDKLSQTRPDTILSSIIGFNDNINVWHAGSLINTVTSQQGVLALIPS